MLNSYAPAAPSSPAAARLISPSKTHLFSGKTLAALGVVFGDIGTSPLYAFRQCFTPPYGVAHSEANIFGLLSLIFWALIMVISVKYVAVMLRADNRGEGGVLALSTLLSGVTRNWRMWTPIGVMGVLGAALFFGDGLLTPAISVLSAVEGLAVATPHLQRFVIPVTVGVLLCLFIAQKQGTHVVGRIFGPVMIPWFVALALLGLAQIVQAPRVLQALNPMFAFEFFVRNEWQGFVALSAVFLAVTGGEALYADMGHFGRLPIRNAWLQLVLPALTLNYFGQGALLLQLPDAASNPFYLMAPVWALPPLIVLATAATIIASQAVISGVFSVTSQAQNLGYLPRIRIRHSSATEMGQVYVPSMNWVLFAGTVLLVLTFKSSDALAGAYGIAVSSTMLMAGIMVNMLAYIRKQERRGLTFVLLLTISLIDLAFFCSNLLKFFEGGWFPVTTAIVIYLLMTTWSEGRRALNWTISCEQTSARDFLTGLADTPPQRAVGTAVYLASEASVIPRSMSQSVRFYGVLHERNILLTFVSVATSRLEPNEMISVESLAPGVYRVIARHGFMQQPNAVAALRAAAEFGLEYKPDETVFITGRNAALVTHRRGMAMWRKRLFAFMSRNSEMAPAHYGVPVHRLIEIGSQTAL
jgi:KUP system potassium uptake protein